MTFDLDDPPFAGATGRTVSVAVVDSGINPHNPHVGAVAGGVAIAEDGSLHDDLLDRLGHGTAVAAAIQEKARGANLHVVKVFERRLSTRPENLVRAIDWATERRIRLVNLSLGVGEAHREALEHAVNRAQAGGMLVVAARAHRGRRWFPGSLAGVVGVEADAGCRRDELRMVETPGEGMVPAQVLGAGGAARGASSTRPGLHDPDRTPGTQSGAIFSASPLPRPIPGVPPENNVRGISFAVANVTGFVARALERHPGVRAWEDLLELLARVHATRTP